MARMFYKRKNGLSTIVVTMILIALSLAAIALVWGFVSNMINGQIKNSEACFGNYNKVQINPQYTCYETTNNVNYNLRFSLSVGDVSVDKIIVSVSSASATKSYTITNSASSVSGLEMYPNAGDGKVIAPDKNSGLTYKATGFGSIDSIKIAPVLGGTQCDVSDSITEIGDCSLMV
ncbi:Uncharacterised protein [uncultured archaeon]|nr:Uncharacterised protein [uncultured archaeon]